MDLEARNTKVVISASRRTDMLSFYSSKLIDILKTKYPPEKVHTLVLWTKDPRHLVKNSQVRGTLAPYNKFIHLTITGLGGTPIEPNVPTTDVVLTLVPKVIEIIGSDPRKLLIRIDPILDLTYQGIKYSNLPLFEEIIERSRSHGVRRFVTSFCTFYSKVVRRLRKLGVIWNDLAQNNRDECLDILKGYSKVFNVEILSCCIEGLPAARCIDGNLLTQLHPLRELTDTHKALGQRPLCGCTRSIDIGWYTMQCPGGCLYCYANPTIHISQRV
ncbi:MAG: DUF1848 family protein [Candidatus Heimdallarchaeota archaeon]